MATGANQLKEVDDALGRWVVAALIVSMLIPWVGGGVAYVIVIFSILATYSAPAILASAWSPRVGQIRA